ncbi:MULTISPECIES: F0F1 ATP synthase subunit B [unclassified Rothia (in: high G+C Gram-positive bacteria)]|uniref:F0F1 ATP synthase subunit B n=1 Tax=unclassified Rothia (in: high G+C Gram-positive bacteria) TaxID=2689056 RepID=UPI00195E450C|nr:MULTISPECIES: F0F1 ATP synthase subunit B [unclassified Rothia (in: high G+C Gram-positive bacteria)]MBM7050994.1 F0F1 ATP synthase subunit B [Rothia sp. ZJ1223]QRZ62277.1 F0F1 ATP synthase subunit B [Rothia sp. ZJ932]
MSHLMAAAEGHANPLFPNPWEIAIAAIGFLLLLGIVIKFVVPMFERIYQDRKEAIEGGLAKAEKAQAEAAAARDEYNQQLESARLEAQKIREEARAEGEAILADFKQRATVEATRITDNAQKTIEAERAAALTSLRAEVGTLATVLAGKIVGESLNDDARSNRVVDRFLADLETEQQSVGATR